jgi:hypothetical protein
MRGTMRVRNHRSTGEEGFIFLSGLALASSLLIFLSIGAIRSVTELSASERFLAKQRAFYLAEGRLDEALVQLAADPSATGNCATAADPAYGTSACLITDPGDGTRVITATGTVLGVQQNLQAVVEPQGGVSPFQWALFGDQLVSIWGNWAEEYENTVVDSYDSTGAPGGENQATVQTNNGLIMVGVGSPLPPWSEWARGVDLYGDAVIGPGGDTTAQILDSTTPGYASHGVVHGEKRAAAAPVELPVLATPPGAPSGGPLNSCPEDPVIDVADFGYSSIILPSDCEITLAGDGVVHLDDLDIGQDSEVHIEGNVTLSTASMTMRPQAIFRVTSGSASVYVNETADLDAGDFRFVNVTEDPKNLTLYIQAEEQVGGGMPIVTIATHGLPTPAATFYGAVYVPHGTITLTGGHLYGSFVSKMTSVHVYANVHYDVSLKNLEVDGSGGGSGAGGSGSVAIRSWQQL